MKMSKEKLHKMLIDEEFNIDDVVDAVVELNHLIGVGTIGLYRYVGDNLSVGLIEKLEALDVELLTAKEVMQDKADKWDEHVTNLAEHGGV